MTAEIRTYPNGVTDVEQDYNYIGERNRYQITEHTSQTYSWVVEGTIVDVVWSLSRRLGLDAAQRIELLEKRRLTIRDWKKNPLLMCATSVQIFQLHNVQ